MPFVCKKNGQRHLFSKRVDIHYVKRKNKNSDSFSASVQAWEKKRKKNTDAHPEMTKSES